VATRYRTATGDETTISIRGISSLQLARDVMSPTDHMNNVYKWYIFDVLAFEFDPEKSQANKNKHGIDFIEAQELWNDQDRLVEPARTSNKERLMLIGRIDCLYWSAVFTRRRDRIRLISVRRSRRKEMALYEDQGQ